MERKVDLEALLWQLDDPECLEQPQAYDSGRLATFFVALVSRLDADFGTCCAVERDIQDSSQYGRIEVPAEVTACRTRIVVSVSKFGNLAVISADNPGAFLDTADAQAEGELDALDLVKVEEALIELGCVVIPEELLTRRYTGPSPLIWRGSLAQPSWWDRFFGSF